MIKGRGQRLIPEELLKYLEAYKENHPDPAGGGGGATLEDIVDSAGNKRFVEGNGIPQEKTGYTATYCKWSLSGTHLMCVVAATLAANVYLGQTVSIADFNIPSYIGSKIFPTYRKVVEIKPITLYDANGLVNQTATCSLSYENNKISIIPKADLHSASDNYFRIQFDLLIDADYSD